MHLFVPTFSWLYLALSLYLCHPIAMPRNGLLQLLHKTNSLRLSIGNVPRSLSRMHFSAVSSNAATTEHRKHNTQRIDLNKSVKDINLPLIAEEEDIFRIFRQFCDEKATGVKVRVAGGWVRDKLLGLPSKYDIDLALENSTGVRFALALQNWFVEKGLKHMKFGVIQQNPDKSKHLETVRAHYGNLSLDFVNLRTEQYTEQSRIPLMALGTPEEDAYRRDLTINSLFYNIHTQQVEDSTGKGLDDLRHRIIRTPLPSLVTLTDDPLRTLRAIRFACRFNFTIAEDLYIACQDASVHSALLSKVSHERMWNEVQLMLSNPRYLRAVTLLHTLGVLPLFIPFPSSSLYIEKNKNFIEVESKEDLKVDQIYHAATISVLLFEYMDIQVRTNERSHPRLSKMLAHLLSVPDMKRNVIMALLTYQMKDIYYNDAKNKKIPVTDYMFRVWLKMSGKIIGSIHNVHEASTSSQEFLDILLNNLPSQQSSNEKAFLHSDHVDVRNRLQRNLGGKVVKNINQLQLGQHMVKYEEAFYGSVVISAVYTIISNLMHSDKSDGSKESMERIYSQMGSILAKKCYLSSQDYIPTSENIDTHSISMMMDETDKVLKKVEELLGVIEEFRFLPGDLTALSKPLLDGHQLKQLFPELTKTKPAAVGEMMSLQLKWRLCHYPQENSQDLTDFLKSCYKSE